MLIVGLSGYARSGKDTIANQLVAKHDFKKMSFADPIKEALLKLNPIIQGGIRLKELVAEYGWEETKDEFPEARHLLQRLGAEVGREMFGPTFWIRQMEHRIKHSSADRIVIADVRYPNEAQMIKANNGVVWRVRRPDFVPVNAHGSESAMDNWDFDQVFYNSGSVKDLQALVQARMMMYV